MDETDITVEPIPFEACADLFAQDSAFAARENEEGFLHLLRVSQFLLS